MLTPQDFISDVSSSVWTISAILVSFAGVVVRAYTIGTTPRGTSGRNTKKQVAESLNTSEFTVQCATLFIWATI